MKTSSTSPFLYFHEVCIPKSTLRHPKSVLPFVCVFVCKKLSFKQPAPSSIFLLHTASTFRAVYFLFFCLFCLPVCVASVVLLIVKLYTLKVQPYYPFTKSKYRRATLCVRRTLQLFVCCIVIVVLKLLPCCNHKSARCRCGPRRKQLHYCCCFYCKLLKYHPNVTDNRNIVKMGRKKHPMWATFKKPDAPNGLKTAGAE